MRVLGLDPGQTGALAILNGSQVILLEDLPVHLITPRSPGSRKAPRPELDLHGLCRLLTEHTPIAHAFVERVAARPGQGVTSMFRFGVSFGALQGIVVALGMPMTLVQPKDWQRWAQCGPSPDGARQRATQLFPDSAEKLVRKKDCHRADALLLAAYGAAAVAAAAPD